MNELRLILLVIGALVVGAIYYFGRRGGAGRPLHRKTPIIGLSADEDVVASQVDAEARQDPSIGPGLGALADSSDTSLLPQEPEQIITLFIRAREGRPIAGEKIVDAAEKVGLSFGEKQIFHRLHQGADDASVAIFSMANLTNPGGFELHRWRQISTPGLCLFLTLPNPLSALDAWDAMHAAGQRLADLLDSDLLDESQSTLSHQRIAHIRDEMRAYDRRQETPMFD